MIGLGVGTLAAYGRPGDRIRFYEIDPAVVRIARDPSMFTFLSDSRATVSFTIGDGRLELPDQPGEEAPGAVEERRHSARAAREQAQRGDVNTPVVISAERKVSYEAVVNVMDKLQRAGVKRVGLSVKQGA